jgi:type I restriction enzyme S subunit
VRDEEVVSKADSPLPDGWEQEKVKDCLSTDGIERRPSIPRSAYRTQGRFPVVDQGQPLIAGFTDDEASVHRRDLPLIVFGDHTRAVKFVDFPFATGADGTKLLRAKNRIDPRFLYYALMNIDLPSRGYNRHFGLLRQKVVDLPCDQEEQREIARVLLKLQARVEVQDRIIATLKELKAATMAKLLREGLRGEPVNQTEIGEIPQSWTVTTLGKVFDIRYGLGQPPRKDKSGVPMVRATDIKRGRVVSERVIRVARGDIPATRNAFLKKGDLIVVRSGAYTGDVAEYEGNWDEAVAGYDLVLSPRDGGVNSTFVTHFLLSNFAQTYFRSHRDRAAQPHLNAAQVGLTPVALPTNEEQDEIAHVLRSLSRRLDLAESLRGRLGVVFSETLRSLMARRLRVNR